MSASPSQNNLKITLDLAEKITKVKGEAVFQANNQSFGTFAAFDSSFANILVPVIPPKTNYSC
jgi:hypothetical protein